MEYTNCDSRTSLRHGSKGGGCSTEQLQLGHLVQAKPREDRATAVDTGGIPRENRRKLLLYTKVKSEEWDGMLIGEDLMKITLVVEKPEVRIFQ